MTTRSGRLVRLEMPTRARWQDDRSFVREILSRILNAFAGEAPAELEARCREMLDDPRSLDAWAGYLNHHPIPSREELSDARLRGTDPHGHA
jgi:hypothetical protein